ncbi:MAG: hypothetical protein WBB74_05410 [Gaiellaceae bacterium]
MLTVAWLAARGSAMPPPVHLARALTIHRPRPADPRVIRRFRSEAWRWQILMGKRRSRGPIEPSTWRVLRFWKHRALASRQQAMHPPNERAWLCIHRFEASWHDSGDPYWGGLQMDRGFMSAYAPRYLLRRGWANRWTPLEQIWVGERARRAGRGFSPWPSSARLCGVL